MNKLIICNIPMKAKSPAVYESTDSSVPSSDKKLIYPVNGFLENTLNPDDNVKVLLLVKKSATGSTDESIEVFKRELESANEKAKARIEITEINTDFSQKRAVHEELLSGIIDNINVGDHIICDITYGPKDMPIIVFTACNFAENHLDCQIDNIIYGQAEFDDNGQVVNTKLCDMSPLYYLNAVTNTFESDDPQRAKDLFKALISI